MILVLAVTLFIKNQIISKNKIYTYLLALSVPLVLLVLLGSSIIFLRYIYKLRISHKNTYTLLTISISFISILLIGFSIMIGIYFDDPRKFRYIIFFSLIPYYLAIFILIILYIRLSPGFVANSPASSADILIKKEIKQMEFYQVIMVAVYLIALVLYPVIFILFILENSQK